jgi:hypothetical protein
MRLRDISNIIDRELKVIESIQMFPDTANNRWTINNVNGALGSFDNLMNISTFKDEINKLLSAYPFLRTIRKSLDVDQRSFNSIKSQIENIIYKCHILKETLSQIIDLFKNPVGSRTSPAKCSAFCCF